MISLEQAKALVNLARSSIQLGFSRRQPSVAGELKKNFSEKRGVFVTIKINNQLRGCIGFTEAIYPVYDGIIKASQAAAFSDPRFPRLSKEEFPHISIEISILTVPKRIEVRNPEDYFKKINVGIDGLLVVGTFQSGLLLPQVALEYNWDAKTFLEQTCIKAGLHPDSYTDYDNCRVYTFQSHVFSEQSPNGEILKVM